MDKVIRIWLPIVLLLSLTTTISAQEQNQLTYTIGDSDIEVPSAQSQADILNKLGLFAMMW